ncbi:MAG TPA: hypothetical protein VFY45_24800 [Baekduia sp.]|nr:hypothetical protein [Baekduia sp.]
MAADNQQHVTSASPARTASRPGKYNAQWPSVWPGVGTILGAPGTRSVPESP